MGTKIGHRGDGDHAPRGNPAATHRKPLPHGPRLSSNPAVASEEMLEMNVFSRKVLLAANVREYGEGKKAWIAAGLPVESYSSLPCKASRDWSAGNHKVPGPLRADNNDRV